MIKTERNCLLQFFASEIKYSSQFSYAFLCRSKWAADGAYSDIFENGDQFQVQFQPPVHKQTAFSAIRKRMFSKTIPKRDGGENVGLSFFFFFGGGGVGGAHPCTLPPRSGLAYRSFSLMWSAAMQIGQFRLALSLRFDVRSH